MASNYENFFSGTSFAVTGHSKKKDFPKLTYKGLKSIGKVVYPVDPSVSEIDGDKVYPDFDSLPGKVDRIILETPKQETRDWVAKATDVGVKDVWIHMDCETPEALKLANDKDINVCYGTCAVMYVTPGFSFHSFHKIIMKLLGKY